MLREACTVGADRGWRMFFYGATEDVVDKLVRHLEAANPGLQVVGRISPPYRPEDCKGSAQKVQVLNQVKKVLEGERRKLSERAGNAGARKGG